MISVIICTRNRASSLQQVLEDLAGLSHPCDEVEIVVVDNNSKDQTAEVVERFSRNSLFPVRYALEKQQGIGYARNRGVFEAAGDWIIFTDDDVRIGTEWLNLLLKYAKDGDASAVGGRIIPVWPTILPRWVATSGPYTHPGAFVEYNLGDVSRPLTHQDPEPYTCNAGFSKALFQKYGLFRTDLHKQGEDTEFFMRLRQAGVAVHYVADAFVHHPVDINRLSLRYLMRWKFWAGYSSGKMTNHDKVRAVCGVPAFTVRQLLIAVVQCVHHGLRLNPRAVVFYYGAVLGRVGFIYGTLAKKMCLLCVKISKMFLKWLAL